MITFKAIPVGVPNPRTFAQLRRRAAIANAQELNTQRRQMRTLVTKFLKGVLQISPVRRIRNRTVLPSAGKARSDRLRAWGLSLVHVWPARYFLRSTRGRNARAFVSLPMGGRLAESASTGQPFVADGRLGRNVFRRAARPRRRVNAEGESTWLPIKQQWVLTEGVGNAAIERALEKLAREWPDRIAKRLDKEIRRVLRGA